MNFTLMHILIYTCIAVHPFLGIEPMLVWDLNNEREIFCSDFRCDVFYVYDVTSPYPATDDSKIYL